MTVPISAASRLSDKVKAVVAGERDLIANAANAAAVIYGHLRDVNWAGFYFLRGTQLVLGPFQGKPACVRIQLGRGVCGTAAARRETIVVRDVHQFPGHIACDSASQSEVVVPLMIGDRLVGVLDVDSPVLARFAPDEVYELEQAARILLAASDVPA